MSLQLGQGREFAAIEGIAQRLGARASGLGDDCAVLPWGEESLVLSTDMSVEGVHFRREWLTWAEIGWRSAAGALSDLAAAGATPVGILVSVGVPEDGHTAVDDLMEGAADAAASVGAKVLGGDLTKAPSTTLDVCVVGKTSHPMSRRGAVPGDRLWVSGSLGGARAALDSWRGGSEPVAALRERFAHPVPRVALGRWLAEHGAHAMIDLSDGLAGDAGHLAARSEVALTIHLERLPVESEVDDVAGRAGEPAGAFAAAGGEDYELLAAMPSTFGAADADTLREETGVPLCLVGHVEAGAGVRLLLDGVAQTLSGYDHFRR